MKRTLGLIMAAAALLAASPAEAKKARHGAGGQITIESWLHGSFSATGLSATVKACFRLRGALSDQGGKPRWNNAASYADKSNPPAQCGDERPVGGAILVPPMSAATLYANHTMRGKKGRIFITFAGVYDLVTTLTGSGTWVITGGTGAYRGLEGEGTVSADASTFPYARHTSTGVVRYPDDD
jgi:hypothetical protein